ncbi:MAG TPA: hypothetical protein VH593_30395, partial [Ktedonobacteraceae bacterium]
MHFVRGVVIDTENFLIYRIIAGIVCEVVVVPAADHPVIKIRHWQNVGIPGAGLWTLIFLFAAILQAGTIVLIPAVIYV